MYENYYEYHKRGIQGKNIGIPLTGLRKLGMFTSDLQKSRYWLVGGESSTGKTSFVDEFFVLQVLDWYYKEGKKLGFKVSIIYNSMERNYIYKLSKWTAWKLYMDTGLLVSSESMSGHNSQFIGIDEEITKEHEIIAQHGELLESYIDFFNPILKDDLLLYDEATGPTGIFKRCTQFAFKHGKKREKQYGWDYEYNHPLHYVIIVNDHVGKIKSESNLTNDKQILDKHAEYQGILREKYLFIPIDIYQFNRSISDSQRKANGDMFPTLADFKGTSDGVENADHVLALFNPYRHNLSKFNGHETDFFISPSGKNRFRNVSLLKNSYGADDLDVALGFLGEVGKFYELETADKMNHEERVRLSKLLKLEKYKTTGFSLAQFNFD